MANCTSYFLYEEPSIFHFNPNLPPRRDFLQSHAIRCEHGIARGVLNFCGVPDKLESQSARWIVLPVAKDGGEACNQ
jgi:hypothetical protein